SIAFANARLIYRLVLNGRGAAIDLDGARLLAFGQFALQLQMKQAVFEAGALDLDIVGQLEAQLEGALGNAAMEEFAFGIGSLGWLGALDDQGVFLGLDG